MGHEREFFELNTGRPIPERLRDALHYLLGVSEAEAKAAYQKSLDPGERRLMFEPRTRSKAEIDLAFDLLSTLNIAKHESYAVLDGLHYGPVTLTCLRNFVSDIDLEILPFLRLMLLTGKLNPVGENHDWSFGTTFGSMLQVYRRTHRSPKDLRHLGACFTALGMDDRSLGDTYLGTFYTRMLPWEPQAIWPYFAEHVDFLDHALSGDDRAVRFNRFGPVSCRQRALEVLSWFPSVPQHLVPLLWELALGGPKHERDIAQSAVLKLPEAQQKIGAALSNGRQELRKIAADWVAKSDIRGTENALLNAFRNEKSEQVKASILRALDRLEVPLSEFLDRRALEREAQAGLKKMKENVLSWFRFEALPPLHWTDNEEPVDNNIIKWFMLQSLEAKSPQANPLHRLYLSCIRQTERESMGLFVLQSWIAEDTAPTYTKEEATQRADEEAARTRSQYPHLYPDVEKHRRQLYSVYSIQCKGSAIKDVGVLSVAAACGGSQLVEPVSQYLRQWYGTRFNQSKSLIQMIADVDHPAAIQFLLAVGNRFRTKGIQKEAEHLVQTLAEKKGWTRDELADRTVPTAGLGEDGKMELSYGKRTFFITLNSQLDFIVRDESDLTSKMLPEAHTEEDETKVKEVKTYFSTVNKELKSVLQIQKARLYEAMCTQRSWTFDDWQTFLCRHPIVRFYCQALVWVAFRSDKLIASVRLRQDGSVTNSENEPVILDEGVIIKLAHDSNIDAETRQSWLRHFTQAKLIPLFPQFGRQAYSLCPENRDDYEITDRRGYLIEAFKLRAHATKLGYSRETSEDNGWFYTYWKTFSALKIAATIEFTGNSLPEWNRPVALISLRFSPITFAHGNEEPGEEPLRIGEVPPVLLTECYNDWYSIAAAGEGFDPDWEKATSA